MQFLWLEGVDFAEHIDDTNDLSTIRGASLGLLEAGAAAMSFLAGRFGQANVTQVFTGASMTLFEVNASEAQTIAAADALLNALAGRFAADIDVQNPPPPLGALRFVYGMADVPENPRDAKAAIARAHGRARFMQMNGGAPRQARPPGRNVNLSGAMCAISRSRAADRKLPLSAGQRERMNIADADVSGAVPVSQSVYLRRAYGRVARERFFKQRENATGFDEKRFSFTRDLHQMVDLSPPELDPKVRVHLPMSVRDKIAVFYADGNGFGKIRSALGGGPDALAAFSRDVTNLMEGKVLRGALSLLQGRALSRDPVLQISAAYNGDGPEGDEFGLRERLRFELLMFGGDEICFAAPAWLGLDMATTFFEQVKGATVSHKGVSRYLTFKAGLVFSPMKMPIATSRKLAKELSELAKGAGTDNRLGIATFESMEPPAGGFADWRKRAVGSATRPGFAGDGFETFISHAKTLKASGIRRSQLYNMLREAQWPLVNGSRASWPLDLGLSEANERAAAVYKAYKNSAGVNLRSPFADGLFDDKAEAALNAYDVTELWDYIDPFNHSGNA